MDDQAPGPAGIGAPEHARGTVLVVDDHPEVVALIATVLEAQGHRVLRASTVAAARQWLDGDEPCDVVLTDINLSGDSGLRLVSSLRAAGHPTSVVLMSGLPAQDAAEVPDDVAAFLQKPFSLAELTGAVDEALRSR